MLAALINATIFTGRDVVENKALVFENDRIKAIVDKNTLPENAVLIDCGGDNIAPGLMDLQVYGGGGYLFSSKPSAEALRAMAQSLAESGTTSFFLTLATNAPEMFREAISIVKQNAADGLLGLHFEGPYINPLKRGAHIKELIRKPEVDEVREWLQLADGHLKMMTLAPEVCDAAVLRLLTDGGVVLSAGHSNASFEEAINGFRDGITAVTHLFNAMSPFHHRDTGLPGAAFESGQVRASIIADGIHVDFKALSVAKRLLQERLFLITDAVEESLEGAYIHVRHPDRYTLPDGTLSGSGLTLLKAVQNCVEKVGIPLDEALRMASTYPAQVINAKDKGRLLPGYKADIIVFDRTFQLKKVFIQGKALQKYLSVT